MKQVCHWGGNVLPDWLDVIYILLNEVGQFSDIVGDQADVFRVVKHVKPEHKCCILKVSFEHSNEASLSLGRFHLTVGVGDK